MNRRRGVLLIALVVLAGAYLAAGGVGLSTDDPPDGDVETVDDAELIQPTENGKLPVALHQPVDIGAGSNARDQPADSRATR